jgi:hypothetical protein
VISPTALPYLHLWSVSSGPGPRPRATPGWRRSICLCAAWRETPCWIQPHPGTEHLKSPRAVPGPESRRFMVPKGAVWATKGQRTPCYTLHTAIGLKESEPFKVTNPGVRRVLCSVDRLATNEGGWQVVHRFEPVQPPLSSLIPPLQLGPDYMCAHVTTHFGCFFQDANRPGSLRGGHQKTSLSPTNVPLASARLKGHGGQQRGRLDQEQKVQVHLWRVEVFGCRWNEDRPSPR